MSVPDGLSVAVVGLGFGEAFVPIYLHHPDVAEVAICELNEEKLEEVGDKFEVTRRFNSLDDVLAAGDIDAVHLLTPVAVHGEQTLAVLKAGKRCACAIPMARKRDELEAIIALQRRVKKHYMMMETAVYTREFLFVKDLYERGEFGTLTFVRGAQLQDMGDGRTTGWGFRR
jgi:predicted dehydrogenase